MDLTERRFEELSALRYRLFTCELGGNHGATAMVLQFIGEYGIGSEGNGDASFMRVTTLAALSAWHVDAVVFDLRELRYEWGNAIWSVFGHGIDRSGVEGLPTALVVSDRCRQGFSTCDGMVPKMFDDLESAIAGVGPPAIEQLDRLFADVDGNVQTRGQHSIPARSLRDRLRALFGRR